MTRTLVALLLVMLWTVADAANEPARAASGAMTRRKPASTAPVRLVDLNSASKDELKTLPGVGDAEAAKIVANRPYLTKTELVTKGVLQTGPFTSLRHHVVAMPPKKAATKPAKPAKAAKTPAAKASQPAPKS